MVSTVTAALAEGFRGAAAVLVPGEDDVARFEQPWRGPAGQAALVVLPSTVEEVRAVVAVAVSERVRLLPQGAVTGLVGASVPPADAPTVVLTTERLRAPLDVDPLAATATVGAGVRLSELNAVAARHRLELPVDLTADPSIGGMVATNTGGNRVLRHGAMRRHVLAVELVAADAMATVFGGGAALRKDSRGVDLAQLVVGSGGALGVITSATVALVPLARSVQTWWLATDNPDRVVEALSCFEERRPGAISAFEFVSREAWRRVLASPGAPADPFAGADHGGFVLAEWTFDGAVPEDGRDAGDAGDSAVDLVAADVAAAVDRDLVTDGRLVDAASAWALRHGVTETLRRLGVVLGHDVSVPRATLMAMRAEAVDAIARIAPDAVVCDFGHVGDGGLHLNVLFPAGHGGPDGATAAAVGEAVFERAAAHAGSYSAEHGLGPLNASRWLAETPQLEQRLIAALKDVVDPGRLLGHPGHPYNQL